MVVKANGTAVSGCDQLGAMPLPLSESEILIRSPMAEYGGRVWETKKKKKKSQKKLQMLFLEH